LFSAWQLSGGGDLRGGAYLEESDRIIFERIFKKWAGGT